jgi:rare lipoprotein A
MRKTNRWCARTMLSISLMSFLSVSLAKVEKQDEPTTRKDGIASYYSDKFHGRSTSSGESYDKDDLTAAHNTLPLGSVLLVTNLSNNQSVVVRVNDRLNKANKRLLDVSKKAAKELGFIRSGHTKVKIEILGIT